MKNVADIYGLSPMQQGLLFHALSDSSNGAYVERISWQLSGDLDVDAFRSAWEHTVKSHPILRTSFHHEGLDVPVQVVHQRVELPWLQHDWLRLPTDEQEQRFADLLKEERERGFKLHSAPLLRLTLLQLRPTLYRFLWSYHHLLLDGWSISLVLRHVLQAYEALRRSQSPPLAAGRPYCDYIGWLQQQDVKAAEVFWREKLRGFTVPTIPGVERRIREEAAPAERYRKLYRVMSVETTTALQSMVRQHQLTLSPLVQGAWALLLSRYSGGREVLFGSVVSGRPTTLAGAETMVGLFINTLPVRVKVSEDECLLGFLKELQAQQVEMQQYQYSPLRQVQQWSEVRNGQPLFDSVVVVRNLPIDESLQQQGAATEVKDLLHHEMATGHPLTLGVLLEQGLRLQLTYDTEKYEEETIQRMLGHVEHLLEEIATNPDRCLSELPLLTAAEQHYLSATVNATERNFASEALAHVLFEQQAARRPETTALSLGETDISYGELNERANQLAQLLLARGIGRGQLVAVCLERSAESVIALLGIWKAGAAYLPLEVEQPLARLRLMLQDAGPALVISTAELSGRLELEQRADGSEQPVLCVDTAAAELRGQLHSNPEQAVEQSELAYVIYTSGSTGQPKGVEVEQGQLLNTLQGAQERYQFSEQDVVACQAPFAFDISLFELLTPLLAGGRVLLVSGRELLEESAAAAVLKQVTYLHAAPGLMRQLAGFIGAQPAGSYAQVRAVMVGGDAVSPELLEQLRQALPGARLYVGYGPTEAAVMCAAYEVNGAGPVEHRMLGYPLANSKLRLYDGQAQLVPVGVVGEVYIGGRSVSRGYLRSAELTAAKYVELEGERWYRSGDLGRRLRDGSIAFAGRADGQVKVRGYRIEMGEVEAALESHASVRAAAVAVKEGRGAGRLVGYVVRAAGAVINGGELREHVGGLLPEYMVPLVIVELEQLPLTALAKVDRKALPDPGDSYSELEQGYLAPGTLIEEMVAGIWAEMLRVDRVGLNDNFFEAGGDSLLATQLMSRVRETLQVEVALRELFEHPTVAGLAERVAEALRAGVGMSAPPLARAPRDGPLVLSFAQQRLWFIDQLQPGSTLYNMPHALRMLGQLKVEVLEQTLTEIVRRHEVLRTTFSIVAGQPVQTINPAEPIKLRVIDLSRLNEIEREEKTKQLITKESLRAFDLSRGPLLRVSVIKLAKDEHITLFTTQHIVSDGWSIGVLIKEVAALYTAFINSEPSPLTELEVQYADFAHWQREWLTGEVLAKELDYWKGQLSAAPAVLELPTDHPRPPQQSHRGARHSFTFPSALKRSLAELSRREGVTLFMTLLAAWQTLLMRYSGQQDIVVGIPVANRNYKDTEALIGFFVNMLAIRTDLSGDPSFSALLARVRETALGAYAHQDLPFEKLVEELQPVRSMGHTPLFQVIFVLENMQAWMLQLPGLQLSPVEQHSETAHFDLSLGMAETAEGLGGILEYNTDIFERETIERMVVHFQNLLASVVADPEQRLSELTVLTAAEQHYLSATVNATERSFASEALAHVLFEQQAARRPEATALSLGETDISYGELNERANQLAQLLLARGIGRGQLVAVCLERSAESVIALLGIWKAGAAYLPLEVEQPLARLRLMLQDAGPALVISTAELSGRLELEQRADGSEQPVLCVDTAAAELRGQLHSNPEQAVAQSELAYVIYTSGSTGQPKGVEVEQGQLLNTLQGAQERYQFSEQDVVACQAPFAFDISLFELLTPLLAGGRVLLVSGRELLEESAAAAVLKQVTYLHAAPGLMRQLAGFIGAQPAGSYAQVRAVMVGGDAVSPELLEQLRQALPGARLYVGYGPTEAAVMCAAYEVNGAGPVEHRMLGYPLANSKLRLYDGQAQLVPVGVVGEVYIGGRSVSRGYLRSAELTAAKYVELEGERWYRSGDLGRRLRDGSIAFAGRADGQVKVRGYRIEMGEVEAALESHASVRAAAVAVKEGRGAGRLVGYVVRAAGAVINGGELREHVGGLLPEYMVPLVIVELEQLPLTALAKVDRKALPELEQVNREREYEAPRTAVEEVLCDIWSEVLKVERVGISESFFELGGHSLLATQLMSRVRETLQVEVALRELFEHPTVAGLAERVAEAQRAGMGVSAPPLARAERSGPLVLSFAQQRMWFIDQLRPGSALYNSSERVFLSGQLDLSAMAATLTEIVRRHEMLRTTFRVVAGEPEQEIHRPQPLPLSVIDLTELSEPEREIEIQRLAARETQQPFDLSQGPLLRVTLLRLNVEDYLLLHTMHHIVSDGWSMGVLIREVAALYTAFVKGQPSPLAELPVQYADFAVWQREWLQGEVLEAQVAYWKCQLDGAPSVLELPTDHPRPPLQSHRGAHHQFEIPGGLTESLRELSREERVTLFMTLLSAWQTLLMRYSGQRDIVVGTTIANRNRRETEPLIGFFVNTLVLRTDMSGDPSFRELLARAKKVALGAYAHQDLPFEKLVEELQPVRSMSHTPLFQVMFGLENVPREPLQLPGLQLCPMNGKADTAKFDLSLAMQEDGDIVGGLLGYNTDIFERETIERMAVHFQNLLASVVADPEQRLSELTVLTAAEQHYLSATVNATERNFASEALAHVLFEQQAARRPEATALSLGETDISYGELNERANQLAQLLLARGIGRGQLVAVCLERSAESVIALLGIWKAGAAYLPLEVEQPLARLRLMLQDAGPALVISTAELSGRLELEQRADGSEQPVLCVDTAAAELRGQLHSNPEQAVEQSELAYVIYTSGSTGQPKGVEVEQGQLLNTLQGAQERYQFSEQDVVACQAPFAFDISLFELLTPLLAGGRVLLVSGRELLEESAAAAVLKQVTYLHAAPGLMRQLAGFIGAQPAGSYAQVRAVMVGGDAVSPELLEQLRQALPGARLYVGYGPTEAAVMCAAYEVNGAGPVEHRMLGYPLANSKLRLYDGQAQLVPVGVVGEVYIGGRSVSRGYLKSAELTAAKYVELEGERWYRSGDLGRRLRDGSIAFAGRADGQVKVRGYRIEMGEVEAALESHASVRAAAVAVKEGRGAGRLVGYVVRAAGAVINGGELREHVGGLLPEYMVPLVIVELEQLPLTALAKVDRKALPELEQVNREREYEAPRTAVEEVLCDIWSEVLKVERVGISESFFELGGHSLLATQLMSRVRETLQVEVALRELFEHPTVAGLAERVAEAQRAGMGVSAPPLARAERSGPLVLSFAQQRMWFIDQLRPGSTIYNMLNPARLSGALNVSAMAATLTEIVRRHEMLRTTFRVVAGEPEQEIHRPQPLPLSVIDLTELSEPEREIEIQRLAVRETQQPFDLSQGPLLRATLVKLAEAEHVVLLTLHHIISDGWSMGVLIKEVGALYSAFVKGQPSPLAELPVQYADFAAWQREWLQGDVLANELDYWRKALSNAPAVLELPTDHPRPPQQSHRGTRLSFALPRALTESLQELSHREGVTLFMTLLGAWQTLLMRYSGQQDIVVGTTIANRNRREIESLIGFFVNTLALRTDVSGDPSFKELLARVREVALGAYAHQDLPFEKLVEELQPVRSLSHSPLFQVVFGLENVPREPLELPGLQLSPVEQHNETTIFDLSLGMLETAEGLGGILEYNTDIFERETIERMVAHFQNLLESVVADPQQRLSELTVLTAAEQHYLSATVNATERNFASEALAHVLFEQQAARRPEATALSLGETDISYGELNERANQLAQLLLARGIGRGQLVAVCLERSAESVIALLGIWKAGAAYLPLEVEQPLARLRLMLQDAGPALVISTAELSGRLELEQRADGSEQPVLCVDTAAAELRGQLHSNPEQAVAQSELAYVIYTSGSTGQPKGVEVEQGQLLNTLQGAQERYQFSEQDVVACQAPFAFDISLFELLTPLLAGGRVLLVSGRELLEESAAAAVLKQVTYLHAAPGLMRQLAGFIGAQPAGSYAQVRAVMVGGDAVSPELLEQLRQALPGARLYVGYGPTEAAVMCAAYEVNGAGPVEHRMLGYPLANSKLRLYDGQAQLVPVGVVGEVYIGGRSVSRGYLRSAELTAAKYVELEGERWYRSGDLGRRLRDGSIAFAGRADGQVKVRGYRIEMGEVEAALESHASVRAAAVAVKEGRGAGRLVGYVVRAAGAVINGGELREHVGGLLPEYMVPLVIVELEQLPLTALAKVDRKALPELEQVNREREYEAPRTAVEEVLCDIWSEVLKVERVGISESFFELGGHSLLATQLMSRVRETLQVEVALRELFEHPTVAGLAERVAEAQRAGMGVSAPPLARAERSGPLVLSFAQQRMWFIDQLRPGSTIYNMLNPARLSGALNVSAMAATLTEIVRRHEMLRTTFRVVAGEPEQEIHRPQPLPLSVIDLTELSEPEREIEIQRLAVRETQQPFDLSQGPLLRATLVKLAEAEHVVLLTLHHIISDGWSMGVLIKEVGALYSAFVKGQPSPLAELPVQYADFAAWQREWLQGEVLEAQVAYWKRQLEGATAVLELPTDHPRPPLQSHRGARYSVTFPTALKRSLAELSRREGVTLFMTLLGAWQTLLMRYSGQQDIVVGTTIANRNRRETEPLIGFFVNTLVLRTDVSGDPSFKELLGRVREIALGAYAHQDLPFEKLVEELQPARSMSHTPFFQVTFGFENVPREPLELPGLQLSPVEQHSETAHFDLSLGMAETADGLGGILEYNTDIFERETIERMAVHFQNLLASVVADPEQRLSELTVLTAAEQHYLSATVNATERNFASEALVHELFEQQAARRPEATALSLGERDVSYGELNERANQLAWLLKARGIGRGQLVAVCLERSAESVIALLGIWKAGAAYLPLEVEQPLARLRLMLQDAGPALVISTAELSGRLELEQRADGSEQPVLCVDTAAAELRGQLHSNPEQAVAQSELAYVIYTSGSTGQPKGVEVEQGQLLNTLQGAQERYQFSEQDVVACQAPFAFDISLFELLTPLLAGGRVLLVSGRELLEESAAAAVLKQVTYLHAAPGLMRQLAGFIGAQPAGSYAQVRAVMVGGDAVSPELLEQLRQALPGARLYVGYGPTEAAVMCAAYEVNGAGPVEHRMLGYPLANSKLRLYDGQAQLVPVGVVGEVYIGGRSVSRGYLKSAELTAAKYVELEGERWYRSGDLGRRLRDGSIAFAGRADGQVKVRGYRIEMGEVEAALESHASVRAAAVAVKEGRGAGRLVGYVVRAAGAVINGGELREHVGGLLPEYMVPLVIVELEQLPLTALAKVDRKALPELEQVNREREYEAPRTAVEEVLCDIWSEVLKVERVGISESFFELGGHSLLATQLMSRVRDAFTIELPLRSLFEKPTIAELAVVIEKMLITEINNLSDDEAQALTVGKSG